MNTDEISNRIARLEDWVIEFKRTQRHLTIGEFWEAYRKQDPELLAIIDGRSSGDLPASIRDQLDAMYDGMELLIDGQAYPHRRIDDLSPIDE
jgi:hypothetical protein